MTLAAIMAMTLQAASLGGDPTPRAATADECAVALETLRQFRTSPTHLVVQDRRREVVSLDRCAGGGPRTGEADEWLRIDVDPDRGVATAVYGRCQDWYVSLVRRDGGWLAEAPNQIQDACEALDAPASTKAPARGR